MWKRLADKERTLRQTLQAAAHVMAYPHRPLNDIIPELSLIWHIIL